MCENKYKKIEEKEMKGGSLMRKSGFTLAEVLITLVIIGVIAAMTIPGLLSNTGKAELKTGLKKAVSTITQALTLETATTGNQMAQVANSQEAFNAFMYRNFNINAAKTGDLSNAQANGWVNADGMRFTAVGGSLSGSGWPSFSECDQDGTGTCYFIVDVNGPQKGPNRFGGDNETASETNYITKNSAIRDIYALKIVDNRVEPVGAAVNLFFDDTLTRD